MEYELDAGAHSVYSLDYHLILTIKYRRSVLNDERMVLLKEIAKSVSESYDVHIKNMEHDEDHVHILFRTKPTTEIPKYINVLKSATARKMNDEYADEWQDKLWNGVFWSPSYCLISTGEVSLEKLMEYVEQQGVA